MALRAHRCSAENKADKKHPGTNPPAPSFKGLMLPLGLLIGGLAAVIGTLLVFAAREQDQLAERAGRHLALSALG